MAEKLVQVGWYCWQCEAIRPDACRSDNPPIFTTEEWAEELRDQVDDDVH